MNRDKLIELATLNTTLLPVEFKGETVYLKRLSLANRDNIGHDIVARSESVDSSAMEVLLFYTLCNEAGERLLKREDLDIIANTNDKDFQELIKKSIKLNFGVSDKLVDEIKKK